MKLPGANDRSMIVGATGSGKTVFGLWLLSEQDFTKRPWIIYDFKGDELINKIPATGYIDVTQPIPTKPGLYICSPLPDEQDMVSEQMMNIWRNENTGIFVDEGFMVGRTNRGFRACLTQGRSKKIPMITCSQRPVWLDRFAFSESGFFVIFRLQDKDDLKNVNKFIPHTLGDRLPKYHSYYYDVGSDELAILEPVPDGPAILDSLDVKLRTIKKVV